MKLENPFAAKRNDLGGPVGRLALYKSDAGSSQDRPLLLIHSVNAAASAFEIKPLFEHYTNQRPTFGIDLPGFGFSERSERPYTVRLMTDAIHQATAEIQQTFLGPIDVIALSLSCEFVARAAIERPERFHTLGFISPTGFEGKARDKQPGHKGKAWMRQTLEFSLWSDRLFKLLTAKAVIRKFLEKTWGSKNIRQSLLEYDYQSAHQPGAQHAPYYFVSGYLFSTDILNIYQSLRHPIWMVRGTRGDFVDYHHLPKVADKPNWTIGILDTGAFPQFEALLPLVSSYERFLTAERPA